MSAMSLIAAAAGGIALSSNVTERRALATGIPILRIDTDYARRIDSKENYRGGTFDSGDLSGRCKIRGHGNTTWRIRKGKKPYLLKLDSPAPLYGMESARKWVLLSNLSDKSFMRNAYAFHLARSVFDRQRFVPSCAFVNLFLNGRYEGLYQLSEKIEDERLSLGDGGFLFEVNHPGSRRWSFFTDRMISFSVHDNGTGEERFLEEKRTILEFEESIYSGRFMEKIEKETFVDWYLINEFTKNRDSNFSFSCYLYMDGRTGKIGMGPVWDFDLSCGANSAGGYSSEGWWVTSERYFQEIAKNEEFRNLVRERWSERKATLLESIGWIESEALKIEGAAELDDCVWRNFGRRLWPHIPGWRGRKTHRSQVEYMTGWLLSRYEWMDSEMPRFGG